MENTLNTGFSFDLPKGSSSIIKVIGVGGGGNNALKHMYEKGIHGVDFIICNTDAQTLDNNPITNKVQLGATITEGLGAGADPEVGEKSAIESIDEIKAVLGQGTKMVFITAGMGGGTGTGAAPVIAKIAKEMGILTIAIVTVPFSFEGKRRLDQAEIGLEKLRNNVDSLIVINNDKLRQQFGNLGFKSGFSKADEVLANAAKGMAEVITGYFDVNIDFRDAKSVLQNSGTALMSTGIASGENKAQEAVKKALDSPLLNDNKITGAKNVLLLIRSGNEEATMDEIGLINDHIQQEAGNTADIIFGVGTDEDLGEAISVLVIATGFSADDQKYAGPTEKIRYTLEDTPKSSIQRESPFKSTENTSQKSVNKTTEDRNFFKLDDNINDVKPDFPSNRLSLQEEQKIVSEEQIAELNFCQEETFSKIKNDWENETSEALELFSFEEEEIIETQSFSFEVENPQIEQEVVSEIKGEIASPISFVEEKPISFTFEIRNEGQVQKPTSEKSEPIIETPKTLVVEVEKPILAKKEEIDETTIESLEEFKIIDKSEDRFLERRNKLKEFNSRYQISENENDFETIPAFRRKNISIDTPNASEQNISNFLADNNGRMQLRENKFLNKDVD